jgi:flagellar biosynthesis protein FliQ
MSDTMVISILKDAIVTGLTISAPILIIAMLVGLLISIFQATTQIQEQTLTFVPKLIAIAVVGLIAASWMIRTMVSFTERIFGYISNVIR